MLGAVSIGSGVSASVASAAGNASLAGANLFSGALATGIKSGIAKIGIGQAAATQGVAGTTAGTAAAAQSTVSGIAGAQSALASGGLTGAISGSSVAQAGTALANAGFASSTAATSAATGGFFSKVGSVLGSMTQTNSGRMMLFNGISQGVQQFSESKKEKKERARQRKLNFFGGPAVGGSSILPDNMFFPGFGFETDSSSGFTNDFTTDPGQNIEQFGGFDPRSGTNDPILFENIFDDDFTNSFIA